MNNSLRYSFSFHPGPSLFSGYHALAQLPYELHRRGIRRPAVLYRKDREGERLVKGIRNLSFGSQCTPVYASYQEPPPEYDGVIVLGSHGDPPGSFHGAPMFLILTDFQTCREVSRNAEGIFPEAVFLDPSYYAPFNTEHTAATAVIALTLLLESLQDDRMNPLSFSWTYSGIDHIIGSADCLKTLEGRHGVANAAVSAGITASNTGFGAVSTLAEALAVSGFADRAETCYALLPYVLDKLASQEGMEQLNQFIEHPVTRLQQLLEQLSQLGGLGTQKQQIITLAGCTRSIADSPQSEEIMQFLSILQGVTP